MTATMMADGRKRTLPVTLIHRTAAPAGWLLARVLTVVISPPPPKWHLKCEAMAVLVAQSPQAGPRTWALNPEPGFFLHWGHRPLSQVLRTQILASLSWQNMWKVTLNIAVVHNLTCPQNVLFMLCHVQRLLFVFLFFSCICSAYLKPWFPTDCLPFLFSLLQLCYVYAPKFSLSFTRT